MSIDKKSQIGDFIPQGTLPVGFFVNSEEILAKHLTARANLRIIKLNYYLRVRATLAQTTPSDR